MGKKCGNVYNAIEVIDPLRRRKKYSLMSLSIKLGMLHVNTRPIGITLASHGLYQSFVASLSLERNSRKGKNVTLQFKALVI